MPTDVAACFGAAFADDPVWHWLCGPERARAVVEAITGLGYERHPSEFDVVEGAAAWWHAPEQWRLPLSETLRLLPRVGPIARGRSLRLLRTSALVESQHPDDGSAYLGWLGAAVQGQGRGAAAIAPGLARCDELGWSAYLETSNPRNHAFYQRHGFVLGEPLRVLAGCPPLWPMRRAAQPPR
jgi:RimJ/RimL family protein N-acetyltransferase